MRRSDLQATPQQIVQVPSAQNQLAQVPGQQVIVQLPDSAQLMTLVNHVLANPDGVVQQAVALIDENHNSVCIRERVIVFIEED